MAAFQGADTVRVEETPEHGDEFYLVHEGTEERKKLSHTSVIAVIPISPQNDHYQLLAVQVHEPDDKIGNQGVEAQDGNRGRTFSLINFRSESLPEAFKSRHGIPHIPIHLALCRAPFSPAELSVVVSIKSGLCEAEAFFNGAVQPLLSTLGLSHGHYKVFYTHSEQSIREYASDELCPKANAGISQLILLLSGDGGVIDIINGLFSCNQGPNYVKPAIGLLVVGTGNALANSSGLNTDSTKGLRAFLRGKPRSIPTFATRFSPGSVMLVDQARSTEPLRTSEDGVGIVHGAVVTSWCLHASLVADSDTTEYRKHGRQRFLMAANELLDPSDGSHSHLYHGKVTSYHLDRSGQRRLRVWDRQEHMYILVTLVSNLEAGLTISPRSRPLDGKLRVVDFGPMASSAIKGVFGLAFSGGKHIGEPSVGYDHVDGLRVDLEEPDPHWRRVCVDGKSIRVEEGGWFEVQREERDVVDLVVDA